MRRASVGRKELQRVHVSGPEQPEVPVIERCDLALFESFDHGEDTRVDEADVRIGVTVHELPHTGHVVVTEVLQPVGARLDVAQQRHHGSGSQTSGAQVVHLRQHGLRNDKRFASIFNHAATSQMVSIVPIERRVERARVEDQRHVRGGCRSEASVLAASLGPCDDAPAPRLVGAGANVSALSSSASLTTWANETPR